MLSIICGTQLLTYRTPLLICTLEVRVLAICITRFGHADRPTSVGWAGVGCMAGVIRLEHKACLLSSLGRGLGGDASGRSLSRTARGV